jgi:cob(I)alamin adenosyltransferase
MTRIYTRTGDHGETGLFGGGRVPKSSIRVTAYGELDELNAVLGMTRTRIDDPELGRRLEGIQRDLFAIGAHLATPPGARTVAHLPDLPHGAPGMMEAWMDEVEAEVGPLTRFILPGGSEAAAALHLARTVCRRAERAVVELSHAEDVDADILVYLNRLSDLLFELARLMNRRAGVEDVQWKPQG